MQWPTINKFDEIILVEGSSKIPKIKEILSKKFPNIPLNDSFNPDKTVAYGVTLFCEKLIRNNNEFLKDFDYLDATQHSYGIEVENGIMEILIPRGINIQRILLNFFIIIIQTKFPLTLKFMKVKINIVKIIIFYQNLL